MRKRELKARVYELEDAGILLRNQLDASRKFANTLDLDLTKSRQAEQSYRELAVHYKGECDVLRQTIEAYGARIDDLIDEFRSEVMTAGTGVSPLRTTPINVT